ncbi:thioredoxin family protein [Halorubrum sp. DTA98]|uniref:thioredoxin family protein n=1 Tax=Halorubrum sp. DTA98 TaxID=3402163 RepID=UPI003AABC1D5
MDGTNDERQRIRERKKRELQQRLENGGDPASGGDGDAGVEIPDEPIAIEGTEHLQRVVSDHAVVLVDCYADWCGPCQMLEPTIEALAAERVAAVAKVDVDAHPGLAQQLGIRGVPTLVLYADGEAVERTSGVQDKATLQALIDRYA